MLKFIAALALLSLSSQISATNSGYPIEWDRSGAGPDIDISQYKTVWADEFETLSLDVEPKFGGDYYSHWFAPVHAQLGLGRMAAPTDPAFSVNGGLLTMQTRLEGTQWVDTHMQTMDSSGRGFGIQNGYIEIRAKLPEGLGSHAGFWLCSMHNAAKGHTEIDMVESYGRGDAKGHHQGVHLWPGSASTYLTHVGNSNYKGLPTLLDDFHLFGVKLTDDKIEMYFDRKLISSIERLPEQKVRLYLLLSNFHDANRTDGYEPSTMIVDYVHVLQAL